MSAQLEGRAGIITGAAGGIGRSLAGAFVDEGARVAVLDVDAEGASRAAAELGGPGIRRRHHRRRGRRGRGGRDRARVRAARLPGQQRRHPPPGRVPGGRLEEWRRTLDVNLDRRVHLSPGRDPAGMPSAAGAIVNIASIAGILALKNRTAYNTTKAGIIGMTKAMAFELGAARASASTRSARA